MAWALKEGAMDAHRPSAGVHRPPPTSGNDGPVDKLHLSGSSSVGLRKGPKREPARAGISCAYCEITNTIRNGYVGSRGEFDCDECIWILAEKGEFL
jgi:hypothetical protein